MTRLPSRISSAIRRYDPSAMMKSALRNSKNVSVTLEPKSTKQRKKEAVTPTQYSQGSHGIKSSCEANLTSQIVESRWNERACRMKSTSLLSVTKTTSTSNIVASEGRLPGASNAGNVIETSFSA